MIRRAFIQQYDNGQKEPEHQDVFSVLSARGIDCEWVKLRQLQPGEFEFNSETFFAGDHDFMQAVFKKADIAYTKRDSYPESLRSFLNRKVWESTVLQLRINSAKADFEPCFVKPKTDTKLFTGFVVRSAMNLYRLEEFSRHTALHCAELVSWKAEYRVFINRTEMVGIKLYTGNKTHTLDMNVVKKAIAALENSMEKTASYALDFGILENGETALVEWNDGFSLGSYGLDAKIYTDLLIARWLELISLIGN